MLTHYQGSFDNSDPFCRIRIRSDWHDYNSCLVLQGRFERQLDPTDENQEEYHYFKLSFDQSSLFASEDPAYPLFKVASSDGLPTAMLANEKARNGLENDADEDYRLWCLQLSNYGPISSSGLTSSVSLKGGDGGPQRVSFLEAVRKIPNSLPTLNLYFVGDFMRRVEPFLEQLEYYKHPHPLHRYYTVNGRLM